MGCEATVASEHYLDSTTAEGGVSIPRRVLDAYVVGCTERERVYHQPAPFVQDDQCWGHGAHTRRDTQGRVS